MSPIHLIAWGPVWFENKDSGDVSQPQLSVTEGLVASCTGYTSESWGPERMLEPCAPVVYSETWKVWTSRSGYGDFRTLRGESIASVSLDTHYTSAYYGSLCNFWELV